MINKPENSPPCSKWNVWRGKEIEGSNLGEETLFIRRLPSSISLEELRARYPQIDRIWFCSEFLFIEDPEMQVVNEAANLFRTVCVEIVYDGLHTQFIPIALRPKLNIFLKVPYRLLREGDHICVGEPFKDESFRVGTGNKVNPEQYGLDIRIA